MAEGELEKVSTEDKVLDRNGDGIPEFSEVAAEVGHVVPSRLVDDFAGLEYDQELEHHQDQTEEPVEFGQTGEYVGFVIPDLHLLLGRAEVIDHQPEAL